MEKEIDLLPVFHCFGYAFFDQIVKFGNVHVITLYSGTASGVGAGMGMGTGDDHICRWASDDFSGIPGEGKWETQSKNFKVPADGGDCALMLYNRTGVNFYIDDIKIEPLGEAKPGSGTATAAAAAGTASEQVVRPLPPITDEEFSEIINMLRKSKETK